MFLNAKISSFKHLKNHSRKSLSEGRREILKTTHKISKINQSAFEGETIKTEQCLYALFSCQVSEVAPYGSIPFDHDHSSINKPLVDLSKMENMVEVMVELVHVASVIFFC